MTRRLVTALLLLVGLIAGGCGSSLTRESAGRAEFEHMPPPASTAPGIGPVNIVALDGRRLALATTGGAGYLRKTGYLAPSEPGRIELSDDEGASWHTVWEGKNVVFRSLAFRGSLGIAQGSLLDLEAWKRRGFGGSPPGRTLALVSRDAGVHWNRLAAPAPVLASRIELVAAAVWIATANPLRRSDDGGRSWRTLRLPPAAGLVRFATPDLGFAAAHDCLWRTLDGGASWSRLSATCDRPFTDIEIASDGSVFTAQAESWPAAADRPGSIVRRSLDGGRTWEELFSGRRWPAVSRLVFQDAERGWVVSDEDNQGFVRQAVHTTVDGGRTWSLRPFPMLPVAFAGSRAWAANPLSAGLWRTSDWGRSWQVSARPEQLQARKLVAATRTELVVETLAGTLVSRDRGATWKTSPRLTPLAVARLEHLPAYLRPSRPDDAPFVRATAYLSPNGGRSWRPLAPKPDWYETGDVAFLDSRHGLLASGQAGEARVPVYATEDGGRTWRSIPLPRGVEDADEARLGAGVVVIPKPPVLYLSADNGGRWLQVRVRGDFWDCGASRVDRQIWLLCSNEVQPAPSLLLRSDNGGSSWRRFRLSVKLEPRLVAVGHDEAWAIIDDFAAGFARLRRDGALWHTTDGGRKWQQVWLRLQADARSFELLPGVG